MRTSAATSTRLRSDCRLPSALDVVANRRLTIENAGSITLVQDRVRRSSSGTAQLDDRRCATGFLQASSKLRAALDSGPSISEIQPRCSQFAQYPFTTAAFSRSAEHRFTPIAANSPRYDHVAIFELVWSMKFSLNALIFRFRSRPENPAPQRRCCSCGPKAPHHPVPHAGLHWAAALEQARNFPFAVPVCRECEVGALRIGTFCHPPASASFLP